MQGITHGVFPQQIKPGWVKLCGYISKYLDLRQQVYLIQDNNN